MMRVLLVHAEDELRDGPWGSQRWDRVIDLGKAGAGAYARAAAGFGCVVTSLNEFRENFREKRKVRELLALGMGRLGDGFGLDWWELTSIAVHQELEIAFLLRELAGTLGPADEVYVSRPCFHAEVLRLLGTRLHTFSWREDRRERGARHYLRVLKKFPVGQLLEIFWDKTDSGYQFRGSINGSRKPSSDPFVLLPTAYVNVSRTTVAYAESLPETRFRLVATRRSGWIEHLPPNVSMTWLRYYASVRIPAREIECRDLLARWEALRAGLTAVPEFRILAEAGCLDVFPEYFARGLEVRDAWRNVFDREPVQAVICADDSNSYTHIPLILAVQKGLPTISCHHGALDGRYMFKRNHADVLLAKGKMEEDYLVRLCEIPREAVEVGAPIPRGEVKQDVIKGTGAEKKPFIVFFSEAYEAAGGRVRGFYEDILPALADLALAEGRELIIKLHPSESLAERRKIVDEILQPQQQRVSRVLGGKLESEWMEKAWFGVTIMSTVAVECTLRGIPCFVCAWLEAWPYGYVDEFALFGVGIRLNDLDEIKRIPEMLLNYKPSGAVLENCWRPIERQRLQTLLGIGQGAAGSRGASAARRIL